MVEARTWLELPILFRARLVCDDLGSISDDQYVRRWVALFAWVLVAAGLGWWVMHVMALDDAARGEASGYGQFVLAAAGLVILLADKAFASAADPRVDDLVDGLAVAMRNQWEQAAIDRKLRQPAPLPIRWQLCTAPVAGPTSAATTTRDGYAPFDPLPGLGRVTHSALRSGTRKSLHRVYGGLGSGRLVLVGGAGAGKSSAAVLLLLDALRYRDQLSAVERARVPVPVFFTLADWDPATTPVQDWLVTKLTEIPLLRGRRSAAALVRDGRVSVFLDGLDEIPEQVRPVALQALSEQATVRLVLLTRTAELVGAAAHHPLMGAIALELLPLRPVDVAEHLLRPLTEPAPPGWQALTHSLASTPDSPLSRALTTPLAVGLLRDVYPANAPVEELLDEVRFPDSDSITHHLLDHAITAAYTPRPGRPSPRYTPRTAHSTLVVVAHFLTEHETRDFAWWTIHRWIPLSRRTPLLVLTVGLVFGFASWLNAGPAAAVLVGIVAGFAAGFVFRPGVHTAPTWMPLRRDLWRQFLAPRVLAGGLAGGLLGGFLGELVGSASGLVGGQAVGSVYGLALGIAFGIRSVPSTTTESVSPRRALRDDIVMGLAIGLGFGLLYGIVTGFSEGSVRGVVYGLVGAFGSWAMFSKTSRLAAAQVYLTVRHRTPLRLMRFLDDAHSRDLLRTVGPIYQFRHASLQDRLVTVPLRDHTATDDHAPQ